MMTLTKSRAGFTVIEMSVAFAILATVLVLVAQISYWSLTHRLECIAKHLATEHANNILEAARATPFQDLNDQWGADLGLPKDSRAFLNEGKVGVKVEPEATVPGVKRVTVEISWTQNSSLPPQVVKLMALFSGDAEVKK